MSLSKNTGFDRRKHYASPMMAPAVAYRGRDPAAWNDGYVSAGFMHMGAGL